MAFFAGVTPRRMRSAWCRSDPRAVRELLGDGSFGGAYQAPDEVMLRIWEVAVDETRALLEGAAWEGAA